MLLHLDGALDRDEPISDFLHRRGYGRDGRNLRREYQDRSTDPPMAAGRRPAAPVRPTHPNRARRQPRRPQAARLRRPEHSNQLRHVRAPKKPGVYMFSEDGQPVFVGRSGDLKTRLAHHRSFLPKLSNLACRMARIATGRTALKSFRSASSAQHLHDTDDAFRDAFDQAVDRIRAMEVAFVEVPEDEDAGTLQALIELHVAVQLGTLDLAGGGYNSFRNI